MNHKTIDNWQDKAGAKGVHIISICDASCDEAKDLEKKIVEVSRRWNFVKEWDDNQIKEDFLRNLWEEYHFWLKQLHTKFLKRQVCINNITTTVGRSVFAQRLSGTTTYSGTVNYGALGTDATSPVVGDTTLGTETYRKALSSGTFSGKTAFLENFYTATEVSGTFEEYGFFIDGTGTADTGQLFNRFTQTVTKSVTETLNVQSQVDFNDA